MNWHNLRSVIAFETVRTITKVHFWALTLGLPLLIAALSWLIGASNSTVEASADQFEKVSFSFTYADASGVIDAGVAQSLGGKPATDEQGVAAVIAGTSEAHLSFPADPLTQPVKVAGKNMGLFANGRYASLVDTVLGESVTKRIGDPRLAALASHTAEASVVTYTDGQPAGDLQSMILPGLFLVLFYLSILLLGGQMLNVTVEEKENRVTEMILTTMSPTTLIIGKVLALVVVGILQMVVVTVPALLIFGLGGPSMGVSPADLGSSPINPAAMAVGFLLFLGGFLMFTGMLVAIGSVMPNSKEASGAFGAVVVAMFIPFYAAPMVVADPHGIGSQVLLFFPLTSPVTALLRNAIGGLTLWEAAACLVLLGLCALVFLRLGVRLFRTGSISYDVRLNLRKALRSRAS